LYMKGVFLWNTQSTENLYKSLDAFKEATEADPDFADPYAYIAFIYYFIGFIGLMPAQSAADACRNAAAKAININPEHPQALLAESIIRLLYDFDWEGGKRLLEKSIALNPNNSFAHIMLASYYFIRLDKENATRHMQFARRIDPLGGFTNGFVVEMLNGDGKYKEAIEVCEEILSLEPENGYVILGHTTALGFQNGFASVIPKIEEGRKLWGEFPTIMATLGMAYAIEGETEKAEEIIQWFLKAEKKEEGILMDQVAMVYGHLNRADDFFNKLEESIEKHSINIVWFYKTKMIPETISNDERFKKARMAIALPV
jgi:adenylate cyclase